MLVARNLHKTYGERVLGSLFGLVPVVVSFALLASARGLAIDGLDAMTWRAQGIDSVVFPLLAMPGCSALFAALAVRGFRRREN